MSAIEFQDGVKVSLEELLLGVSKMDTTSLEKVSVEINRLIAQRKVSKASKREVELIQIVYNPLEKKIQERYDFLVQKNLENSLSKEEHGELLQLVEKAEQHNVAWLEALVELAQIRGTTLEEVKKQIGVRTPIQS